MKKYRIKLVALFVAVALMLPSFTGAGALVENEVDDVLLTIAEVEEIVQREAPATEAIEKLTNSWQTSSDEIVYPKAFGGCYIDDDYHLVVKVVDNDPIFMSEVEKITGLNTIVFEETDISFNNLLNLYERIPEIMGDMDLVSWGVSQEKSRVVVTVPESAIMPLSNIDPHIEVCIAEQKDEPMQPYSISRDPGKAFGVGSLGWYGTYENAPSSYDNMAILTAGHVAYDMKEDSYHGDIYFGNTLVFPYSRFNSSSYCKINFATSGSISGDYAFLVCSNVTPSNTLEMQDGTVIIRNYYSAGVHDLQGKTVFKAYGSSGFKSSTVKTSPTSYTYTDHESDSFVASVDISDVSSVYGDDFCDHGDSGAPVFTGSSNSELQLCGIISGNDTRYGGLSYFTNMTSIVNSGFVPYFG